MSFLDKAKDLLGKNADKVGDAIDKAGDFVDNKTGGKYAQHVDKAQDAAKDAVGKLGEQGTDPANKDTPPA
ncbi:antitoxin [[Mycobacterium] wendilense]|uniref:Antitoxin n=1 Tax=[Mycobacterium] wendilense TaxID=3064284 RepID=A0ABN9NUN1_9MYCO|nr:antitoxin [Mycolicibacterium sp. MU0050]CAJ1579986.1 antitoxin [Mycolicibacterium sp. MU0050]